MKFIVAKNIAYRTLESEVVLLNLKNGLYYVLNETASRIWEWVFVDKKGIKKLISYLVSEYHIDDDKSIKKDIDAQLNYWLQENLIEKA